MVTLSSELNQAFQQFFQQLNQTTDVPPPLLVAWSGGLDSTVLVHALRHYVFANKLPNDFSTVHVNHGLSPSANAWQQHCELLARQWRIPHKTLVLSLDLGANIEARARRARYQALALHGAQQACLLTAHHQQDQAETLLARLFQGAGIQGLSGMSSLRPLHSVSDNIPDKSQWLGRPLLTVSQQALCDYASAHQLTWVTDPMNSDTHYERVFMRTELWPVLATRYQQPAASIAKTAQLLQQTSALLAEYQRLDWHAWSQSAQSFDWPYLLSMSWPRQQALIARWFDTYHGLSLRGQHWQWFQQQAFVAEPKRHPQILVAGLPMQRYQSRIYYPAIAPVFDMPITDYAQLQDWVNEHWPIEFNVPERLYVFPLRLRNRKAGDNFSGVSLKKWFQSRGIAPWLREAWPVVENEQGCYLLGVN